MKAIMVVLAVAVLCSGCFSSAVVGSVRAARRVEYAQAARAGGDVVLMGVNVSEPGYGDAWTERPLAMTLATAGDVIGTAGLGWAIVEVVKELSGGGSTEINTGGGDYYETNGDGNDQGDDSHDDNSSGE